MYDKFAQLSPNPFHPEDLTEPQLAPSRDTILIFGEFAYTLVVEEKIDRLQLIHEIDSQY
jgi:hypothetical protein